MVGERKVAAKELNRDHGSTKRRERRKKEDTKILPHKNMAGGGRGRGRGRTIKKILYSTAAVSLSLRRVAAGFKPYSSSLSFSAMPPKAREV